jgi:hypothetical protein
MSIKNIRNSFSRFPDFHYDSHEEPTTYRDIFRNVILMYLLVVYNLPTTLLHCICYSVNIMDFERLSHTGLAR